MKQVLTIAVASAVMAGFVGVSAKADPYAAFRTVNYTYECNQYNNWCGRHHTYRAVDNNVANIQSRLMGLGYYVGPQGANGVFNSATKTAVRQFQYDYNLKIDGIVGPETAGALNRHSSAYYTYGYNYGYQPGYYDTYRPLGYRYSITQ